MATKKQIAQVMGAAIIAAERYYRDSVNQLLGKAEGFTKGAGLDKPEYDHLTIAQALEKRNEEIKHKIHDIKVEATRIGMEATQSGNGSTRAVENGASNKPYLSGLNPEQIKADAREYMARLVCYVWCMFPEHKSKDRACDYVFQSAKDGDRLYGDCNRARNLLQAYNYNPNTIKLEAAKLHAALVIWRKKTGLEYPRNWRDMVKESKAKEAKSAKQRRGRN